MPIFSFVILYVDSPPASAGFYAGLLDRQPIESSQTFAMFELQPGVMLGLWSRHTVEPTAMGQPGAGEIAFTVSSAQDVRETHQDWSRRGVSILQRPTELDFGHSFVALDPDGHRLRVFAPVAA